MDQIKLKGKFVSLDGFKIYDNGLWRQYDPSNKLSELVEESKLDLLGVEGNLYELYICEQPPEDIRELMVNDIGEDSHVYLVVSSIDVERRAYLWPY